ncbi:MAG TPA: hypothetical protein VMZ33_06920, partial [Candidatus Limnocylindrales bacterium]|nr:hypothetical protein [Candidatus Limnocylindrales bacterium]
FFGSDGHIRRDADVVATLVEAARSDPRLGEVVATIDDIPAGFGAFGVLLAGQTHSRSDIVVKVNAQPIERAWLTALDLVDPGVVPHVVAQGDVLAALPLGWLAMERLGHQPPGMGAAEWYPPLLRGTDRWQAAAVSIDDLPVVETIDDAWISRWLDVALADSADAHLRRLRDRFQEDWAWVVDQCPVVPCHGDVHFFNAGSRSGSADEPLVLFDPIPRLAPWAYDAANTQALTNYHRFADGRPSLVEQAAVLRGARGLDVPDGPTMQRVSALLCAWLAVCWSVWFSQVAPELRGTAMDYVKRAVAIDR